MTTTIFGYTIDVDSCEHVEALRAKAEQFRDADDYDGLERWLCAGAPLDEEVAQ
jgi:hypothetical protein